MTDNEIIELTRKGDRVAFTQLMEKYQNQVFNISYGFLSDYDDASDATQEVFIKVYRSIASFKGQSSFITWLYVICRNVCNDILRKRQRRGVSVSIYSDNEDEDYVKEIKSDAPSPDEMVEQSEREMAVREAINMLKPEYKEVIVYSDMQQLSYDEVAQILKCPVGTVKSRLNRARAALRKNLADKRELFL